MSLPVVIEPTFGRCVASVRLGDDSDGHSGPCACLRRSAARERSLDRPVCESRRVVGFRVGVS